MLTETIDTIIIGAGLSGIYAAYLLSQRNKTFVVLEARERNGSNNNQCPYGLTGFLGIPAVQRDHQRLIIDAILSQLAIIYGPPAAQPTAFFYQDWAHERFTATRFDQPPMYEHPLYHPPAGKTSIWGGTIHFAGTAFYHDRSGKEHMRLCYSYIPESQIAEGIRRLAHLVSEILANTK